MPLLTPRRLRLSALLFLGALTSTTQAAEPLVWKFEPALKNRYQITTDMEITIDLGPGGKQAQHITNIIDMVWTVDSVKEDGSAVLKQRISRMRMTIAPPTGDKVEFDSRSTDEPQGFAAMIAPLFGEMTRAEFTVTMTPRGQVTDVEVPESLIAAIAASPGASVMGDMATAEGFKKMVGRSSFELPEILEAGAEWTTMVETANPVLGTQTITTTYRYEGPREVDGVQFEVFKPTLEIKFAGGAATVTITKQDSSGEVLFNRTAGRLESMDLDHGMTLSLVADGKTIGQTIAQTTAMTWLAEDAE